MKPTFTYVLVLCLCVTAATAQNGSPYWSTSGNNNAAGTSLLGTTNPISLHIFTNNVQRVYIDSLNGRIGIGTATPQDRLHINSSQGENAFRAQVNGVTRLMVHSNGGVAIGANTTPPQSGGLYVLGNTGLGNAAPTYKLQVNGDIAIDSGVYRLGGDPVLKYNALNQSIALGNSGGTGTRLNVAVGYQALLNNTTGQANVALGHQALLSNILGYSNVAIGSHALYSNIFNRQLVAIGDSALYSSNGGVGLVAIGSKALYSNTNGGYNVGIGYQALYSNTSGFDNTAIGHQALYSNTGSGYANTANGYQALYANTSGSQNTATGLQALWKNTTGWNNVANGVSALQQNTSGNSNVASGYGAAGANNNGNSNVAIGNYAMSSSLNNSNNVAVGDSALFTFSDGYNADLMVAVGTKAMLANTTGYYNTAIGGQSLVNNTTGYYNTALGASALNTSTTGYGNTALGYNADVNSASRFNATAVGYAATATADNQVMLGNTSVTSVVAAGSYVVYSDGRFKNNIKENVPGLSFINLLKPVTYHYDIQGLNKLIGAPADKKRAGEPDTEKSIASKEKILYTGLVAQDVEAAAKKINYDFSGIHKPQNEKDAYGLAYSDFVVPLVKAVQELSKQNDTKDQVIDSLKTQLASIQNDINTLKAAILSGSNASQSGNTKVILSSGALLQNVPNPFANTTTINYTLPGNYTNASVIITDKVGRTLKTVSLNGGQSGSIQVEASTLAAGAYQYSLIINGRVVDTKQMLLAR